MSRVDTECRRARKHLARMDDLDAADRSVLDLHLRRCPECGDLAERLTQLKALPDQTFELDEARRQKIFDHLTPVVHEISDKLRNDKPSFSYRYAVVAGAGMAAAAALLIVGLLRTDTAPLGRTGAGAALLDRGSGQALSVEAVVDRCEGEVRAGEKSVSDRTRLALSAGVEIELESRARFSFHIEDQLRMALFGEARWRLKTVTEVYMEIHLDKGRLAADLNSSSGRLLEVHTPTAVVRVLGTIFTVEALPGGETQVGVVEGKVEVVPRSGQAETVEVGPDQLVTVPGSTPASALTEKQMELTAELKSIGAEYPEDLTRMVQFDGTPEQVKVEVDGRVIGTTPLTVRLPDGPLSYRLTSPGMEPFTGELGSGAEMDRVSFAMVSAPDYTPSVERIDGDPAAADRQSVRKPASGSDGGGWSLFERARAAMTAGDIPQSIGLIERAIKSLTDDRLISALSLLAECHTSLGEYTKAANILDRIIEMSLDTMVAQNARYEVGRLSMDRLGDLPRARTAFTAYLASRTGGALREEAYYSLCELDSREGVHRQALHCFNEFLRAFPGGHHEPEARLWRGALYQDLERRWAEAERDLLSFIKAKPRHPRVEEARYRVALGRYQVRDQRGALRMIDEYVREHPKGEYLLRVNRLRQALLNPGFSWERDSK